MAGAMGRQRCKHETNAAKLVGRLLPRTFGGQLGDGRRPEHQSVGAGKVAHLNVTQRSTSKQEVEVKTLHHVMVLQQGGCHRQHGCMRLPKCQRDLLHQWLRALPGHLQDLSWAPALTQKRLSEGPIRTPANCMLPHGLPTTGIATW